VTSSPTGQYSNQYTANWAMRGAVFLELALVIPVLVFLITAIFEMGVSLHERMTLTRVLRYVTSEAVKRDRLCVNENAKVASIEGDFRAFMQNSRLNPDEYQVDVSAVTIKLEGGAPYAHKVLQSEVTRLRPKNGWLGARLIEGLRVQFLNNKDLIIERNC
jgi:hypothetical protein